MEEKQNTGLYKKGLIILVILAVLTVAELLFALFGVNLWSLFILIALAKAFLVVRDYMHVGRLFSGEEH